jgi:hypothetical protein
MADERFREAFERREEILTRWPDGKVRSGTVERAAPDDPVYILMLHPWSTTSGHVLDESVVILAHRAADSEVWIAAPGAPDPLPPVTDPGEEKLLD